MHGLRVRVRKLACTGRPRVHGACANVCVLQAKEEAKLLESEALRKAKAEAEEARVRAEAGAKAVQEVRGAHASACPGLERGLCGCENGRERMTA